MSFTADIRVYNHLLTGFDFLGILAKKKRIDELNRRKIVTEGVADINNTGEKFVVSVVDTSKK
jgi:hypothetical protein